MLTPFSDKLSAVYPGNLRATVDKGDVVRLWCVRCAWVQVSLYLTLVGQGRVVLLKGQRRVRLHRRQGCATREAKMSAVACGMR